jgi:hypothetical protein
VENGWAALGPRRRNIPSAWVAPGHSSLGGYHGNSDYDLVCTGGGGGNGRSQGECTGMCGANCDCWESICGSNYKCEYIPSCCAHDKSCARRRQGTYSLCIDAHAVKESCQNNRLR